LRTAVVVAAAAALLVVLLVSLLAFKREEPPQSRREAEVQQPRDRGLFSRLPLFGGRSFGVSKTFVSLPSETA